MSDYGGYTYGDDSDTEENPQEGGGIRDLRQHLKDVSAQLKEMKAENERLQKERQRERVAATLREKGYAPNAATLYTGEPEKLDEWLGTYGDALAKLPSAPGEPENEPEPETPQGPPETTVPASEQAQMQAFSQAGQNGAPPPTTDKAVAEEIANLQTPEDFQAYMARQGNRYNWMQ